MRMTEIRRSTIMMATLVAVPVALHAQNMDAEGFDEESVMVGVPTVDLEARAGVAIPSADLLEYADPGASFGAGAAWWVSDHVALRADGTFANLQGDEGGIVNPVTAPDMNLFHYGGGVEVDVPGRSLATPWNLTINAGAGGTTVDTDDFIETGQGLDDLTETYPNLNAGAEVGRKISEDVLVNVSGQLFYTFMDAEQMSPLAELRVTEGPIEAGVSIPVTLSVRWDLPMNTN